LTRDEFERRYAATPDNIKAELIEGVVYMCSPVRITQHSSPLLDLITWLGVYRASTPGVEGGDNPTVRLDMDNEPQPDALLMVKPQHGGQAKVGEDGYLEGAPELVAEVAASSASYDLHDKKRAYRRNGVKEYIVWRVLDEALDWFILRRGQYEALQPDAAGLLRSEVFPGLCLDPAALLNRDLATVLKRLQDGLASPEHEDFVARLKGAAKPSATL
jgi:Uma2 family endonuclease